MLRLNHLGKLRDFMRFCEANAPELAHDPTPAADGNDALVVDGLHVLQVVARREEHVPALHGPRRALVEPGAIAC